MLINKNQFTVDNDKKTLRKKGKRWIVASALLLGLVAGGSVVANAQPANADETAKGGQTPVVSLASASGSGDNDNSGKPSTAQSVTAQATALHNSLVGSSVVNGSSAVNSADEHSNSSQPVAQSGNDNATQPLNLGNQAQQARGWNFVQHGIHGNDFDKNATANAPKSSVGSSAVADKAVQPNPDTSNAGSALSSNQNSNSNVQPVAKTAPVSAKSGSNAVEPKANLGEQPKANVGTTADNHPVSKKQLGDSSNVITGKHDGLNFKYDKSKGAFEFTSGTLTWNGNDNVPFIGNDNNFNSVVPVPGVTASGVRAIKFDDGIDTSHVTNMSNMFYYDFGLNSLDLGDSFDTSHVTDMSKMFDGVGVQSLTLPSSFDTSHVTDMSKMFDNDSKLQSLTLPSSFDTSNVTNMSDMFKYDYNLQSLTLPSSFDTSKVTNMSNMFNGDSALQSLTIQSPKTKISGNDGLPSNMYKQGGNPSDYNDFSKGNVGTFVISPIVKGNNEGLNYTYNSKTGILEYTSGRANELSLGLCSLLFGSNVLDPKTVKVDSDADFSHVSDMNRMFSGGHESTLILPNNFDTSHVTNMDGMFSDSPNLQSIKGLSNFDVSNVKSHDNMFSGDSNLNRATKDAISNLHFPKENNIITGTLEGLSYKYDKSNQSLEFTSGTANSNLSGLTGVIPIPIPTGHTVRFVDISRKIKSIKFDDGIDTSHVTNMSDMFSGDVALQSLTLPSSFDTSKVTDMNNMFGDDMSLRSIKGLSNFHTNSLVANAGMFSMDEELDQPTKEAIRKAGLDIEHGMYRGLTYVYNPRTKALEFTGGTPGGMSEIIPSDAYDAKTIKVDSDINFSHVTNMRNMFFNGGESTLILPSNFDTSHVTDMSKMFANNYNLQSLTLPSNFDTSNVTSMRSMFGDDYDLSYLNLGNNFDTTKTYSNNADNPQDFMFSGDDWLQEIDIGSADTKFDPYAIMPKGASTVDKQLSTWYRLGNYTSGLMAVPTANLADGKSHVGDWGNYRNKPTASEIKAFHAVPKNVIQGTAVLYLVYNETDGKVISTKDVDIPINGHVGDPTITSDSTGASDLDPWNDERSNYNDNNSDWSIPMNQQTQQELANSPTHTIDHTFTFTGDTSADVNVAYIDTDSGANDQVLGDQDLGVGLGTAGENVELASATDHGPSVDPNTGRRILYILHVPKDFALAHRFNPFVLSGKAQLAVIGGKLPAGDVNTNIYYKDGNKDVGNEALLGKDGAQIPQSDIGKDLYPGYVVDNPNQIYHYTNGNITIQAEKPQTTDLYEYVDANDNDEDFGVGKATGTQGSHYTVTTAPQGFKLANDGTQSFDLNGGRHIVHVVSTASDTDNTTDVPVHSNTVEFKGQIDLHFHDGSKGIKDIFLPYDITTKNNQVINDLLNDTKPSATIPANYLSRVIQQFNTKNFTYDNNVNAKQYDNVAVDPHSSSYVSGKNGDTFNNSEIELDFTANNMPENVHYQYSNGSKSFNEGNTTFTGANDEPGSDNEYATPDANGSDAQGLKPGWHYSKSPNNKWTYGNGGSDASGKYNDSDTVNIVPNHDTDDIHFVLPTSDGSKVTLVSDKTDYSGNDSRATDAGDNGFMPNNSMKGLPTGYHVVNPTNVPYDNGTHDVIIAKNGGTADVHYVPSDGSAIPASDKPSGTFSGNTNSDVDPTKQVPVPKGYHVNKKPSYHFAPQHGQKNPSDNITVSGNAIKGTATLNLVYKETNGRIDDTKTVNIPINGHVGDKAIDVDPWDYDRDAYNDNNADWFIPMDWKVAPNGDNDNYNVSHTFTYVGETSGDLKVRYVDVDHGAVPVDGEQTNKYGQPIVGTQDLGNQGTVDSKIMLGAKGANDGNGVRDLLVVPKGWKLVNKLNPIQLTLTKRNQTLTVGLFMVEPIIHHHNNKPVKPVTPAKPVKPAHKASSASVKPVTPAKPASKKASSASVAPAPVKPASKKASIAPVAPSSKASAKPSSASVAPSSKASVAPSSASVVPSSKASVAPSVAPSSVASQSASSAVQSVASQSASAVAPSSAVQPSAEPSSVASQSVTGSKTLSGQVRHLKSHVASVKAEYGTVAKAPSAVSEKAQSASAVAHGSVASSATAQSSHAEVDREAKAYTRATQAPKTEHAVYVGKNAEPADKGKLPQTGEANSRGGIIAVIAMAFASVMALFGKATDRKHNE